MPPTVLPRPPGIVGRTAPNGRAAVYYFPLGAAEKIRIETRVTRGDGPLQLELHRFAYPAATFISQTQAIEAQLPAGTHYVAVRGPADIEYTIWQRPVVQCPPGCVPAAYLAQTIRELMINVHRQIRLPAPSEEQIRAVTPAHALGLLGNLPPHPAPAPAAAPARAPARAAAPAGGAAIRPILVDGPAVRVVLTAQQNQVLFGAQITTAGLYEWTVLPSPRDQEEVYYLALLSDRNQMLQVSADGHLIGPMAVRSWKASLTVPKSLLITSKVLDVRLRTYHVPPLRPNLDNPPNGDGLLRMGTAIAVLIQDSHPKAQLALDVLTVGHYRFTCIEITGGSSSNPQANAPATMTLIDSAGTTTSGPTAPGVVLEADLTPGRWWIDVQVPDFQRTTPRRYACGVFYLGPPVAHTQVVSEDAHDSA